jgi:hypothetical protein
MHDKLIQILDTPDDYGILALSESGNVYQLRTKITKHSETTDGGYQTEKTLYWKLFMKSPLLME